MLGIQPRLSEKETMLLQKPSCFIYFLYLSHQASLNLIHLNPLYAPSALATSQNKIIFIACVTYIMYLDPIHFPVPHICPLPLHSPKIKQNLREKNEKILKGEKF